VIGVLVENWGVSMAEGFIHDFEGWIVFMACFFVLFIEIWALSRKDFKEKGWENVFGLVEETSKKPVSVSSINNFFPLLGVLIILIGAILTIKPLGEREDYIPERLEFYDFPTQFSNWAGESDTLDAHIVDFLGLSDYVLMNFLNEKNQLVNFYVAYYKTQKHGAVPHSPKQCIPGGGWLISDISESIFKGIDFNRVIITKGKSRQLVYYWYRQRGKNIANEYYLKWNTFIGAFKVRRTDGALIRLTTVVSPEETVEVADERLRQFMMLTNDELQKYVPD
jgi:EpsI family protein